MSPSAESIQYNDRHVFLENSRVQEILFDQYGSKDQKAISTWIPKIFRSLTVEESSVTENAFVRQVVGVWSSQLSTNGERKKFPLFELLGNQKSAPISSINSPILSSCIAVILVLGTISKPVTDPNEDSGTEEKGFMIAILVLILLVLWLKHADAIGYPADIMLPADHEFSEAATS
ncbi:hypothetical protein SISSUDRAFT_1092902 [Sistotremastrum suecicum HHB10207 ss-3]|uniref:Uncharacterized protein n=1 Tax=Sistotremastrum suecicum HHB10207 ss-3 TaxID=1314776 RepID=A0A165XWZ7_9AGAM|nr:hypothetical protein SISSUDRAFT_1092902 [Sistotremastrum suecicum HHB10207 ss-3]